MINMFNTFLSVTIWSSAIIAAVFIIRRLLAQKLSARVFKIIWLCLAIRLILPFDFSIKNAPIEVPVPKEIYVQAPAPQSPSVSNSSNIEGVPLPDTAAPNTSAKVFAFKPGLPQVWLLGAVLFLSAELIGYFAFARRLRKTRQSCEVLNASTVGKVRVYMSPAITSPVLCGYLRPAIYLPQKPYTAQEQESVLQHEMTHYRQGDLWLLLLLLCAAALSWFNPFVHLMRRKAICDIEMTVDEKMLKNADMQQRIKYGQMLFAEISTREGLLMAQYNSGKGTKERFKAILSTTVKGRGRILLCAIIALCTGISLMVSCAPKPTPQSDNDLPAKIISSQPEAPQSDTSSDSQSQLAPSVSEGVAGPASFILPLGIEYTKLSSIHTIKDDNFVCVDIIAPEKTPILAVTDGTIIEAGFDDALGNYIRIDHGGGWQTVYGQCHELKVENGVTVKKGDVIATVGNTGLSSGNHLHFEVGTGSKTMLDILSKWTFEKDLLPLLEQSPYKDKLTSETNENFQFILEGVQNQINSIK